MKPKNIALFISPGPIGRSIAEEALNRKHNVTVIIGDIQEFNLSHPSLVIIKGDVNRNEEVSRCAKNHDVIVFDQELKKHKEGEYFNAMRSIIMGCRNLLIKHLIISNHIQFNNSSMTTGEKDSWKPVQEEQFAALELLRREKDIDWAYFYTISLEFSKKSNLSGNNSLTATPNKERKESLKEYAETIMNEVEKGTSAQLEPEFKLEKKVHDVDSQIKSVLTSDQYSQYSKIKKNLPKENFGRY